MHACSPSAAATTAYRVVKASEDVCNLQVQCRRRQMRRMDSCSRNALCLQTRSLAAAWAVHRRSAKASSFVITNITILPRRRARPRARWGPG
eukprot:1140381-Pelagomonas_calceolata.AAC.7